MFRDFFIKSLRESTCFLSEKYQHGLSPIALFSLQKRQKPYFSENLTQLKPLKTSLLISKITINNAGEQTEFVDKTLRLGLIAHVNRIAKKVNMQQFRHSSKNFSQYKGLKKLSTSKLRVKGYVIFIILWRIFQRIFWSSKYLRVQISTFYSIFFDINVFFDWNKIFSKNNNIGLIAQYLPLQVCYHADAL